MSRQFKPSRARFWSMLGLVLVVGLLGVFASIEFRAKRGRQSPSTQESEQQAPDGAELDSASTGQDVEGLTRVATASASTNATITARRSDGAWTLPVRFSSMAHRFEPVRESYAGRIHVQVREIQHPQDLDLVPHMDPRWKGRASEDVFKRVMDEHEVALTSGPWSDHELEWNDSLTLKEGVFEVRLAEAESAFHLANELAGWVYHVPTVTSIDLPVVATALVRGVVTDEAGLAVPGCYVDARRGDSAFGSTFQSTSTRTDEEGNFELIVPAGGETVVRARSDAYFGQVSLSLAPAEERWVDLVLGEQRARNESFRLELSVTGAPFAYSLAIIPSNGADVPEKELEAAMLRRAGALSRIEHWKPSIDGWALFDSVRSWSYGVFLRPDGTEGPEFAQYIGVVQVDGQDLRQTLPYRSPDPLVVRGRVRTAEGKGTGKLVALRPLTRELTNANSHPAQGAYEFQFPVPQGGRYRLLLDLQAGVEPLTYDVHVDGVAPVDVHWILPGGRVEAWPSGSEDSPRAKRINLWAGTSGSSEPRLVRHSTLWHGRYVFQYLEDGEYELQADGVDARWPVTVKGGKLSSVRLDGVRAD